MPINTQGDILDDEQVEAKIIDKGLTAPRVTKDQIDALMERCNFDIHHIPNTTTMLVTCLLDGFSLAVGKSACVDPDNFDRALGIEIARSNAVKEARSKLWELEGYALKKTMRQCVDG